MKILFLFLLFFLLKGHAQPGQLLFDDTYVHTVELQFFQPGFYDSLTTNYESKTYLRADIRIDGSPVISVGARFKGYSSYMFYPGRKKSFKIDINEFVSGQKYDGLKKFNLNNGYLDPTFQREKLVSDALLEVDVPAPRVAFANVIVNGENWGLYTMVEQIDKTYLADTWFGDDSGNLFKARATSMEWIGNDDSLYYNQFDLKTNEQQNNWQDLVQLIEHINLSSNSEFPSVLSNHLNVERYLKGWAVRNLFVDLDTYFHSGNNFYLYNNSGQFEWICWDFNTAVGTTFGWTLNDLHNLSIFMFVFIYIQ
ncbi:MAG: CotH kinase family protein [Calditrichota bacterium]